jgi:ribosome maturation factor RimP
LAFFKELTKESKQRNEIKAPAGSGKAAGQTKAQAAAQAAVEHIAEVVAARAGLEIVEVELKGAGRNQLLRITIDKPGDDKPGDDKPGGDKPGGVTHTDCETVSREVGEALDAEDPIVGPYQLEVTSPGVERKLKKWQDWERFRGEKAKIVLKEPIGELKHFNGVIARTGEDRSITVELTGGAEVTFPFDKVDRANLRFEW